MPLCCVSALLSLACLRKKGDIKDQYYIVLYCIYILMRANVFIVVWMLVCLDACLLGCMDASMDVCLDVCMYGCMYVWMYVCMYGYMYVWMYVFMYSKWNNKLRCKTIQNLMESFPCYVSTVI